MRAPLIVGVRHDIARHTLLDERCQERFATEIFPQIDTDTLLLLEGNYHPKFHKKSEWLYFWRKWDAEGFLGTRIGPATIGWRDGRLLREGCVEKNTQLLAYAAKYIEPHIILAPDTPSTCAELCVAFVSRRLDYCTGKRRPQSHLQYAQDMLREINQFNIPMIAPARAWSKTGRHAIIVCGALHAITMHRTTGWPVVFLLEDNEKNIRDMAISIVTYILYPEAILGRTLLP